MSSPIAAKPEPAARHERLLSWIAVERGVRAVVLIAVGLVLATHLHTNWSAEVSHFAERLGLDPKSNGIHQIIQSLRKVRSTEQTLFAIVALAYGALEGVEAYGLWRRRRWAEWLTIFATTLLLIPEVWELTKSTTVLKLGGMVLNLVVIAYLVWRVRRQTSSAQRQQALG